MTFTDTLPGGLTFGAQTAGASSLVCTASGQVVSCTGTPNLAAGASTSVTYSVTVSSSASGTLVNAVLLTALGGDPRVPANDAATPSAGSATQGSDKLSAKAAQVVGGGALAVSKALSSINGDSSGTLIKSGDRLVYTITVRETSGTGAAGTTITETVPANTAYSGSGEGWSVSGSAYSQQVSVPAGQTVTKTFTVTAGTLDASTANIVNTVTTSGGTCTNCTVTTPVVQLSQTRSNVTQVNTPYVPAPIPGCVYMGATLLVAPQHGTVAISSNGSILYTPNAGYTGPDSYEYGVQCGSSVQVAITAQVIVIDPSGVIYNAVTRLPVAGASVTLIGPSGSPVPDSLLDTVLGGPNGQVTGADGRYALLIKSNAPSGTYVLRVIAPHGYLDAPSSTIPPKANLYTPALGGGEEYMQRQATAPALADDVTYYLAFAFQLGSSNPAQLSNGVAHNHVPLDPAVSPLPLVVTKTSSKRTVGVGDLVPYRITVRTQDGVARGLANVVDILPSGMRYVAGSGVANGVRSEPVVAANTLTWPNQIIPAHATMTYDLVLSVGAGVTQGNRTNAALVRGANGAQISNRAEAVVAIGPDALFDCTDVIGKVYEDRNGNGQQDNDEPGIANVRLATVNGLLVKTDAFGRYHIACAALPNALMGSNFVLKLDPASLPSGLLVASDNPASARLTASMMHRFDFSVVRSAGLLPLSAADFTSDGKLTEAARTALLARRPDGKFHAVRLSYAASENEEDAAISQRLDDVVALVRQMWPEIGTVDRDIVHAGGSARP